MDTSLNITLYFYLYKFDPIYYNISHNFSIHILSYFLLKNNIFVNSTQLIALFNIDQLYFNLLHL